MSKNFELMNRAEREMEALRFQVAPMPVSPAETAPRGLDPLAREETNRLVQRLFLAMGAGAPRVVVFTGAEHGDGCSWVAAHTAQALASQVAGSVCLVDANLRHPDIHRYFGIDPNQGLTEAILQTGPVRQFAQSTGQRNLWVLPAGKSVPDSHTLLKSARLAARIAELRAEFDHVLIDVPPVNAYVDGLSLGQLVDGFVLVLQANLTRREAARKAKEIIESARLRLLGAVLNKRTFPIPLSIYSRL